MGVQFADRPQFLLPTYKNLNFLIDMYLQHYAHLFDGHMSLVFPRCLDSGIINTVPSILIHIHQPWIEGPTPKFGSDRRRCAAGVWFHPKTTSAWPPFHFWDEERRTLLRLGEARVCSAHHGFPQSLFPRVQERAGCGVSPWTGQQGEAQRSEIDRTFIHILASPRRPSCLPLLKWFPHSAAHGSHLSSLG